MPRTTLPAGKIRTLARRRRELSAAQVVAVGLLLCAICSSRPGRGQTSTAIVDRAVVRYQAAELGGAQRPQYIFERELAFESRLQALADADYPKDSSRPYLDRHVRSALERHVAEALLANLRVDPVPTETELAQQTVVARRILCDRIGGESVLGQAQLEERMSEREVTNMLRRQARASIYLDRMVAPMLTPTRTELRQVYANERHPFTQQSFEDAEVPLKRWWIGHRLADAVEQYYANARQRLIVTVLTE